MSADNGHSSSNNPLAGGHHATAAADVSFATLNPEHHADSSSLAGSNKSSEKRWSGTSGRIARYKDKRMSGIETSNTAKKRNTYYEGTSRLPRKTGGFLLESVFTSGKPKGGGSPRQHNGKAVEPNGHSHSPNRDSDSRQSEDSSQRGSPFPRAPVSEGVGSRAATQIDQRPNMDPAQLVQMALNLSESRKRHVSSSLPVPVSPATGRRVGSGLDSGYGTARSRSFAAKQTSNFNDGLPHSSPASNRPSQHSLEPNGDIVADSDNVLYTFSPATLSRAERARKYFELASEHRRLLESLPPLKPDATAPGNYTIQAKSSPGSAHYHMERVLSHTQSKRQLGRSYNPLQALRNRRLRNRERRPLTAPPDTWQETDRIRNWIDGVEAAARDPSFRPGNDQVRLPPFSGELDTDAVGPETAKRHRRSDTGSSVITRAETGWSIEPAELLADTYWLEMNDNKTIIEDFHGKRIFPPRARASLEVPRYSKEYDRINENSSDRHSLTYVSDNDDRVRHRRRNMLPIPARLRRNHVSRSGSTSSVSSEEARKPPPMPFGISEGGDENIGPLERHMRRMIAKDANGDLSSPELVSPDHWDSRYSQFPKPQSSLERLDRGQRAGGRLSIDLSRRRRPHSTDGRMHSVDHGVASVVELLSDSTSSPIDPGLATSVVQESSAVPDQRSSKTEHKHSRRSHIPILRKHSKERNNIERTDFAIGSGLPITSANSSNSIQPRSSLDSARPNPVKRHRTTESTASSIHRTYTGTTTTDTSAKDSVGRKFFKGGRIGELVRSEGSRLGDRFRGGRDKTVDAPATSDLSRAQSDASDIDDAFDRRSESGPDDENEAISPRGSLELERPRTKYFNQNLPSFKSPFGRNGRSAVGTPISEQCDPFDRRQNATGDLDRAPQFPKINLPDEDSIVNVDPTRSRSEQFLGFDFTRDRRKSASQNNLYLVPSNMTLSLPKRRDGLPVTGLSGHQARRHWSISDQAQSMQVKKVTVRDIARVRALLLASGIKAHEIRSKADTPREEPLPLMSKITAITGLRMDDVARREENAVAARLLSDNISQAVTDFESLLQRFRGETAKNLEMQMSNLTHRASEQLTNIVYETSDEADAFNVELTTKQPQEVKRVDDAVDAMFRQRRRQFRMVRRAGFKLLEWLVLGIMWLVWFVVVLFNSMKKGLVGLVRVVHWLLWF